MVYENCDLILSDISRSISESVLYNQISEHSQPFDEPEALDQLALVLDSIVSMSHNDFDQTGIGKRLLTPFRKIRGLEKVVIIAAEIRVEDIFDTTNFVSGKQILSSATEGDQQTE